MASDMPALEAAILNRITGDTGSGGLLNAGTPLITTVYNSEFPADEDTTTDFPYIVFQVTDSEPADAMRTRVWKRVVVFHVYVLKQPATQYASGDPLTVGSLILRRLEGDWEDQTFQTQPTFGFDRFKPDISSSGWTAGLFKMLSSSAQHEDKVYHWVMELEILDSKAGA